MLKNIGMMVSLVPALLVTACSGPDTGEADKGRTDELRASVKEKMEKSVVVTPIDEATTIDTGLAVGEKVPLNAPLKTSDGETTLSAVLEEGPVVLVFTRSVEWCPFCQTQLKSINAIVGDLGDRGYKIYGVSYDEPGKQDRFSQNQMLGYKMLSDESSTVIDTFGIRDTQYTEGRAVGVPYASVFVVAKNGTILARSVSGDYKKRPTNGQILALVDSI